MATLVSDILDFKGKKITRDQKGDDIKIKGSIHQDKIIIYVYVLINRIFCHCKISDKNLQNVRKNEQSTITVDNSTLLN